MNIYLMGPPGSGKSSVCAHLSKLMKMPTLDVDDQWLEKNWNCSVAKKLSTLGDEAFIQAEGEEVMKLKCRGTIVSLSGSNPLHPESMKHLSHSGLFVYMDTPKKDILDRCKLMKVDRIVGQSTQPLEKILDKRASIYENSYDVRIMIETGSSPEQIANKIHQSLLRSDKYLSTRGLDSDLDFTQVVKTGLAPDRGLFMSKEHSSFTFSELQRLQNLSYPEVTLRVMEKFPLGKLHPSHLRRLLYSAYSTFSNPEVLPVHNLYDHLYLMETYHGPTASFKDLSLQLLPKLLDACINITSSQDKKTTSGLLVATSGDTGTAALDGFVRIANTPVIVLYPYHGVSNVQKAQMQTCSSPNVCVLGVDGDFDFCQTTVKDIFNDENLNKEMSDIVPGLVMGSANSINWGRLLPQVAFTVSSYLKLVQQGAITLGEPVDVCIPTGNFGNMLGAVMAKKLGIPLRRLIAASNDNNVITDFIKTGVYDLRHRSFKATVSPSIDILVSSNLERFLFLLTDGDSKLIQDLFHQLSTNKRFEIGGDLLKLVQDTVMGDWCSEKDCLDTVRRVHHETGKYIDPHTAVAVAVADRINEQDKARGDKRVPILISSTAHFAKFPESMLHAVSEGNPVVQGDIKSMFDQLMKIPHHESSTIHPELAKLPSMERLHNMKIPADKNQVVLEIKKFLQHFTK
ncbi:threonine synthase-like protein [Acrasis kona]|uniref:Threonine synthase-like protein n=1 Tax=Acrasis kona TaxID=1008807 RepID=A0AAW2ZQT4_9EUKA